MQPLFLLLSHQAPHSSTAPNELELAPEEYNRNFTYIGETNRTIFAGTYFNDVRLGPKEMIREISVTLVRELQKAILNCPKTL